MRVLIGAVLIALVVAAPSAGAPSCPGADDIPTTEAGRRQAVHTLRCLVNAERVKRGRAPLRASGRLATAAHGLSTDLGRYDYIGHVDRAGRDVRVRARVAGYRRKRLGEAIGWGTGAQASPAALMDRLMASGPHRRIILGRSFRDLGVGLVLDPPVARRRDGATAVLTLGVHT